MTDDLEKLFEKLPFFLSNHLVYHAYVDQLIEIVLDLGRRPEAHFFEWPRVFITKSNFMARS